MMEQETWKRELAGIRQTLRRGRTAEARAALDALRGAGMVPAQEQWRIHEMYGAVFICAASGSIFPIISLRCIICRSLRQANWPGSTVVMLCFFVTRRRFRRAYRPRMHGCASVFCRRTFFVRRRRFFTLAC